MIINDNICCDDMENNILHNTVSYNEVFDEFGITVNEDNSSVIIIDFCPWCGKKLPFGERRSHWGGSGFEREYHRPFDRFGQGTADSLCPGGYDRPYRHQQREYYCHPFRDPGRAGFYSRTVYA